MGRLKIFSLFFGVGLVSALAPMLVGGCTQCEEFRECTTKPGLRYVECGNTQHEFNDGVSVEDEDIAWDYCYCNSSRLQCENGSSLRMCNYMTVDGSTAAQYNDGTVAELTTAVAGCLEYTGCAIETARCNYGSWYLNCSRGEERAFVSGAGAVFKDEKNAVDTCVARGPGGFLCTPIISDCEDLDSCASSKACSEFCSKPACFNNKNAASCIADPACRWTPQ
ncbi:hypothetical protein [Nannocystis bainbridge]|uniref:Lipoprotein n=1 Tax=Nannocystis bainbridge TaxID=2995303 RepID=A0ABT5E421_9BACT|nr:hypothetical protein [Nannocystis bainbridge]MDC0720591.1 hypothetical protein [Nannocystis bainbridge]